MTQVGLEPRIFPSVSWVSWHNSASRTLNISDQIWVNKRSPRPSPPLPWSYLHSTGASGSLTYLQSIETKSSSKTSGFPGVWAADRKGRTLCKQTFSGLDNCQHWVLNVRLAVMLISRLFSSKLWEFHLQLFFSSLPFSSKSCFPLVGRWKMDAKLKILTRI